ncbi:MAG TPA: 8-amino-7-oxononanoate synthase [Nevskiaceae bacterium]|nr:8-amino-7-oxononanoate synthase [Nevskiaceae bacterium]
MSPALAARLQAGLRQQHEQQLYRRRRVVEGAHGRRLRVDGRDCLNFCSNDYLGLAADPRLAEAAASALRRCGTGSGAASLVSGYNHEHQRLEEALAAFLGCERVLLFSSGWAANLGVLRALLGRGDALVADALNHASLIDGGRLSGARYLRVPHGERDAFAAALDEAASGGGLSLLVTDGVFSMDGDLADLPALSALCQARGAALMVDDAHGFGVLGADGQGVIAHWREAAAAPVLADVLVGTLGKSLGAAGAFVAGEAALIETLIQKARPWVFSTAPPPAMAAAAHEALRLVQAEPERRRRLHAHIAHFQAGARARGLPLGVGGKLSATPIQPLLLGSAARALALSAALFEQGYWVAAIRPPTVPAGTSRLRITLSAAHETADIDGLLDALQAGLAALPAADDSP